MNLVDEVSARFELIAKFIKSYANENMGVQLTFNTCVDGIVIPDYVKVRYPDKICIVLEHQFENLQIHPDRFSVELYFNGNLERIEVPYIAILQIVSQGIGMEINWDMYMQNKNAQHAFMMAVSKLQSPDAVKTKVLMMPAKSKARPAPSGTKSPTSKGSRVIKFPGVER